MRDEKKNKAIRLFAMLLLALPVFLSTLGADSLFSSLLGAVLGVGGDEAVLAFRANVCAELLGALFSVVAFLLLLKNAMDRMVRRGLWLLLLTELYMLYYWSVAFISPGEHAMGVELCGNTLLLLAVVVCCYAWSLLWRNNRLTGEERAWMLFLFMPYALSFVAFFAPMWQRYVPEGSSMYLLPENNPVYILVAFVMNVMRVVAIWFFVNSRLFTAGHEEKDVPENDGTALNRCVLGVMLSAFFIINGLALVYRKAHLFIDL
ncbi:MAG: hypothetical protein IIW75_02095 [Bacteroidaceae bacterium]|nr:hypothetical protein [Bacteroidaceae bacterium]